MVYLVDGVARRESQIICNVHVWENSFTFLQT